MHIERLTGADRVVDVVDAQNGVRRDRVVIAEVAEHQWQHPEVDEVLPVNPRERLGDHRSEADERGNQRSVLA